MVDCYKAIMALAILSGVVVASDRAVAADTAYQAGKFCHASNLIRDTQPLPPLKPILDSIKPPETQAQFIKNLKFSIENHLFFYSHFYSESNIRRVFGSKYIELNDAFGRCTYVMKGFPYLDDRNVRNFVLFTVTPRDRSALLSEFNIEIVVPGKARGRGRLNLDPRYLRNLFYGYQMRFLDDRQGTGEEMKEFKYRGKKSLSYTSIDMSKASKWPSRENFRFSFEKDGEIFSIKINQAERN